MNAELIRSILLCLANDERRQIETKPNTQLAQDIHDVLGRAERDIYLISLNRKEGRH